MHHEAISVLYAPLESEENPSKFSDHSVSKFAFPLIIINSKFQIFKSTVKNGTYLSREKSKKEENNEFKLLNDAVLLTEGSIYIL